MSESEIVLEMKKKKTATMIYVVSASRGTVETMIANDERVYVDGLVFTV